MSMIGRTEHEVLIGTLAERYRIDGHAVREGAQPGELPFDLGGYLPPSIQSLTSILEFDAFPLAGCARSRRRSNGVTGGDSIWSRDRTSTPPRCRGRRTNRSRGKSWRRRWMRRRRRAIRGHGPWRSSNCGWRLNGCCDFRHGRLRCPWTGWFRRAR